MNLSPPALLLAASLALAAGTAAPASWHPVPGAPELDVDLASLQVQRSRVTAWLRWLGRSPLVPELASLRGPRVHRTALLAEFDCGRRTVRPLAANAYDGSGSVVFMSSVPGAMQPVQGDELAWAYDALCEVTRRVE